MPRLGTQRELAALLAAADYCAKQGLPLAKELVSLHGKLTKPVVRPAGAPMAQIEATLVANSNGRVVPVTLGKGQWAALSQAYGDMGATVEDAELVAKWLGEQGWWKAGVTTVSSLRYKWPDWLAKAKAAKKGDQDNGSAWTRLEAEGLE